MALKLTLTGGAIGRATRTLSTGTLSIGRGENNDWVLPDPDRTLSKAHCVISMENGRYVLTDLSTNGVFINGARTQTERDSRTVLTDGDDFRLGQYTVTLAEESDTSSAVWDDGPPRGNAASERPAGHRPAGRPAGPPARSRVQPPCPPRPGPVARRRPVRPPGRGKPSPGCSRPGQFRRQDTAARMARPIAAGPRRCPPPGHADAARRPAGGTRGRYRFRQADRRSVPVPAASAGPEARPCRASRAAAPRSSRPLSGPGRPVRASSCPTAAPGCAGAAAATGRHRAASALAHSGACPSGCIGGCIGGRPGARTRTSSPAAGHGRHSADHAGRGTPRLSRRGGCPERRGRRGPGGHAARGRPGVPRLDGRHTRSADVPRRLERGDAGRANPAAGVQQQRAEVLLQSGGSGDRLAQQQPARVHGPAGRGEGSLARHQDARDRGG